MKGCPILRANALEAQMCASNSKCEEQQVLRELSANRMQRLKKENRVLLSNLKVQQRHVSALVDREQQAIKDALRLPCKEADAAQNESRILGAKVSTRIRNTSFVQLN
jgi:hypothetical protein